MSSADTPFARQASIDNPEDYVEILLDDKEFYEYNSLYLNLPLSLTCLAIFYIISKQHFNLPLCGCYA